MYIYIYMHYNWSSKRGNQRRNESFAFPLESFNFFRRSVSGWRRPEGKRDRDTPLPCSSSGRERWLRPRSTSRPIRRCSKFFETTLPTHLRSHFLLPRRKRRRRRRRIRSIGKTFCRHFTTLPSRYKYCLHHFIVNNYYRTFCKINLKVSPRRQVVEDPRFEFEKLTREYTK